MKFSLQSTGHWLTPAPAYCRRSAMDFKQAAAMVDEAVTFADSRPTIEVVPGELDRLASRAELAIAKSAIPVFRRGGVLVRPIAQEVPASRGRMTMTAGFRE